MARLAIRDTGDRVDSRRDGIDVGDASADPNPSCNGANHGAFANVNGNFGWLGGDGGTPGYHDGAVGQESGATGYNNSHVDCG